MELRLRSPTSGATLVDLTLSLMIMGMVILIADSKYHDYVKKTKTTAAIMQISTLFALVSAYETEYDDVDTGNVIERDYSSTTSCHKDNVYGFKLTDCTKPSYWLNVGGGNNVIIVRAIEEVVDGKTVIFECDWPTSQPDIWAKNHLALWNPWPGGVCECAIPFIKDNFSGFTTGVFKGDVNGNSAVEGLDVSSAGVTGC